MYDERDFIMYGCNGAMRLYTENQIKAASDHRQRGVWGHCYSKTLFPHEASLPSVDQLSHDASLLLKSLIIRILSFSSSNLLRHSSVSSSFLYNSSVHELFLWGTYPTTIILHAPLLQSYSHIQDLCFPFAIGDILNCPFFFQQ